MTLLEGVEQQKYGQKTGNPLSDVLLMCVCCFVLLTDIGESLRCRGQFLSALAWGGRILTLHLNYVAAYTGPLLFLFERTQQLLR